MSRHRQATSSVAQHELRTLHPPLATRHAPHPTLALIHATTLPLFVPTTNTPLHAHKQRYFKSATPLTPPLPGTTHQAHQLHHPGLAAGHHLLVLLVARALRAVLHQRHLQVGVLAAHLQRSTAQRKHSVSPGVAELAMQMRPLTLGDQAQHIHRHSAAQRCPAFTSAVNTAQRPTAAARARPPSPSVHPLAPHPSHQPGPALPSIPLANRAAQQLIHAILERIHSQHTLPPAQPSAAQQSPARSRCAAAARAHPPSPQKPPPVVRCSQRRG